MEVYKEVSPPDNFDVSPYGLFSAINWATPDTPHVFGGISYDADCTEVGVTSSPCVSGAPESATLTKAATWSHTVRGARPFTVYDEIDCSAPGGGYENASERALMGLTRSAPTQVEATFWTGSSGLGTPVFPNLTVTGVIRDSTNRIILQPASTLISGVPLDIVEGLGALETALASCYDGLGVIHAPIRVAEELVANRLCYERNGKLYTYVGNQVVIGKGYPGTGPNGSTPAAGSMWMFATSPIFGYRNTARTIATPVESLNPTVNTIKMIAEQTFVLGWRCCLAGVLVTTGGEGAGEPLTPLADS